MSESFKKSNAKIKGKISSKKTAVVNKLKGNKTLIVGGVIIAIIFVLFIVLYFVFFNKKEDPKETAPRMSLDENTDTSPETNNDKKGWKIRYLRVYRRQGSTIMAIKSMELFFNNVKLKATGGSVKPNDKSVAELNEGKIVSTQDTNLATVKENETPRAEIMLDFGSEVVADRVFCEMHQPKSTTQDRVSGKVFEALNESKQVVLSFQFTKSKPQCQFVYPSTAAQN